MQDIDKASTEINRHKVKIVTGEKMTKQLSKSIEESAVEKEKAVGAKEKMTAIFKEVEQKAFVVQDNYKKTQEVNFFGVCIIVTEANSHACLD